MSDIHNFSAPVFLQPPTIPFLSSLSQQLSPHCSGLFLLVIHGGPKPGSRSGLCLSPPPPLFLSLQTLTGPVKWEQQLCLRVMSRNKLKSAKALFPELGPNLITPVLPLFSLHASHTILGKLATLSSFLVFSLDESAPRPSHCLAHLSSVHFK